MTFRTIIPELARQPAGEGDGDTAQPAKGQGQPAPAPAPEPQPVGSQTPGKTAAGGEDHDLSFGPAEADPQAAQRHAGRDPQMLRAEARALERTALTEGSGPRAQRAGARAQELRQAAAQADAQAAGQDAQQATSSGDPNSGPTRQPSHAADDSDVVTNARGEVDVAQTLANRVQMDAHTLQAQFTAFDRLVEPAGQDVAEMGVEKAEEAVKGQVYGGDAQAMQTAAQDVNRAIDATFPPKQAKQVRQRLVESGLWSSPRTHKTVVSFARQVLGKGA